MQIPLGSLDAQPIIDRCTQASQAAMTEALMPFSERILALENKPSQPQGTGTSAGPTQKVVTPADFPTADAFDSFLKSWPGGLIFLTKGIYKTAGYSSTAPEAGGYLRPGTILQGEQGTEVHLELRDQSDGWLRILASPVHRTGLYGGDTELRDFTVLSDSVATKKAIAFASLCGPNCKIQRLKFKGIALNYSIDTNQQECFPIAISDLPGYPTENCLIEDNIFYGQLQSPLLRQFTMVSIAGAFAPCKNSHIRRNALYIRGLTNSYGNGYAIGGAQGCSIENNFLDGFLYGVYQDSFPMDGLAIRNNRFINCQAGIILKNEGDIGWNYSPGYTIWKNIHIHSNDVVLKNSTVGDEDWGNSGIVITNSNIRTKTVNGQVMLLDSFRDIFIHGNMITLANTPATGRENWAIIATQNGGKLIPGLVVLDNWCHPALRNSYIPTVQMNANVA